MNLMLKRTDDENELIYDEPITEQEHADALRRVMRAASLFVGGAAFAMTAISGALTLAEVADLVAETVTTGLLSLCSIIYGLS